MVADGTPRTEFKSEIEAVVKSVLDIKVETAEDLKALMQWCNKLLRCSAMLYEVYKDNLYFSDEKRLLALMQLREKQVTENE